MVVGLCVLPSNSVEEGDDLLAAQLEGGPTAWLGEFLDLALWEKNLQGCAETLRLEKVETIYFYQQTFFFLTGWNYIDKSFEELKTSCFNLIFGKCCNNTDKKTF